MKRLSTHAACAKAIRKELKALYPDTKFRVYCDSIDSVYVEWENCVTTDTIRGLLAKYKYGSFDGMTDYYDFNNKRDDIPQVKYIFVKRKITDNIYLAYFEYIKKTYAGGENLTSLDAENPTNDKAWTWTARELINRELLDIDLTNGLSIGVELAKIESAKAA